MTGDLGGKAASIGSAADERLENGLAIPPSNRLSANGAHIADKPL
jgi:hypothetical protein